ncbi:MAG: DUF3326 domain-containing protein, partial [Cyanothece sp. SIO2G6]|nr:DUF3326 domain-containing protein [Cyanothece sp. SIO2G6]
QAPHFQPSTVSATPHRIMATDVNAVVLPATACGSSAVLSFVQTGAQIITVADNQTTMQVSPAALKIPALTVQSYPEAIGALVAQKAGIELAALYSDQHFARKGNPSSALQSLSSVPMT